MPTDPASMRSRSCVRAAGWQPTHEANGLPDLIGIPLAAITARQVSDDTAVAVGVEVLVEVIGHELDDDAALE
jgi:hypothetical protein